MLENLTKRFDALAKKLCGRGRLTEHLIDETLRDVRLALLEADVHFKVVQSFIADVRKKAVGAEVLESLTPGQQVVKIVGQELCLLLGGNPQGAKNEAADQGIPPQTKNVMLVGLQGVGKTTTAAKLGLFYKKQGRKVLLIETDLKRPAAASQLQTLARAIDLPVVLPHENEDLRSVVARGLTQGQALGADLRIFDTAGRIEADPALMQEMRAMREQIAPEDVFLVADAMTGHTAISVAESFHRHVGITGVVLTKTEGDARGGALLSLRALTGAPVRFIGVGEKVEALEPFYPDRMASRILGMGDLRSLVEQAEKHFAPISKQEKGVRSNTLTLEDFREQLTQMKKIESLGSWIEKIPGLAGRVALPDSSQMEKTLRRTEAILSSMTPAERQSPGILNGSRRLRIAKGSGTSVTQVNQLLKQFDQMKKMFKTAYAGRRDWKNPLQALLGGQPVAQR